jgi:hypothetical protein
MKPALIDLYALDYTDVAGSSSSAASERRSGMAILSKLREAQQKLQMVGELVTACIRTDTETTGAAEADKFSSAAQKLLGTVSNGKAILQPLVRSYWARLAKTKLEARDYEGCIVRSNFLILGPERRFI